MVAICIDNDILHAENAASLCRSLPQIEKAIVFTEPTEALAWVSDNHADIVLLDTIISDTSGFDLAEQFRSIIPSISLIFVTAYSEYAVEAFEHHPAGYLLKPLDVVKLAKTIDYALSIMPKRLSSRVRVNTFGNFDVFIDNMPVRFKLSKSKELLAYLVDRQGCTVSRREAFGILWENRLYDRGMQKQFDVIIRSLRATLREYGIEDIFELEHGCMRVVPEKFSCDLYMFNSGDKGAVSLYRGEYMNSYSWANQMEGLIYENATKK